MGLLFLVMKNDQPQFRQQYRKISRALTTKEARHKKTHLHDTPKQQK